jgi:hypothetical protein
MAGGQNLFAATDVDEACQKKEIFHDDSDDFFSHSMQGEEAFQSGTEEQTGVAKSVLSGVESVLRNDSPASVILYALKTRSFVRPPLLPLSRAPPAV